MKLPFGRYHFAQPAHNSPEAEAQFFLDRSPDLKTDTLRPVLDFETPPGDPFWAARWCAYVERKTGIRPVVYSYTSFIFSMGAANVEMSGLNKYALWRADYGRNDGARHTLAPIVFWPTALHQYTSNGHVPGIEGSVDLSEALNPDALKMPAPAKKVAVKFNYWLWLRWRLGEGEFKKWGPANPKHRPALPALVPAWAWDRAKAFLARRRKPVIVPLARKPWEKGRGMFVAWGPWYKSSTPQAEAKALVQKVAASGLKWLAIEAAFDNLGIAGVVKSECDRLGLDYGIWEVPSGDPLGSVQAFKAGFYIANVEGPAHAPASLELPVAVITNSLALADAQRYIKAGYQPMLEAYLQDNPGFDWSAVPKGTLIVAGVYHDYALSKYPRWDAIYMAEAMTDADWATVRAYQ